MTVAVLTLADAGRQAHVDKQKQALARWSPRSATSNPTWGRTATWRGPATPPETGPWPTARST